MINQALKIELLKFLKQTPKSEKEAQELEVQAMALASRAGVVMSKRREGEAFPFGFFTYPSYDGWNIGAFFKEGETITGWRWSRKRNRAESWRSSRGRR